MRHETRLRSAVAVDARLRARSSSYASYDRRGAAHALQQFGSQHAERLGVRSSAGCGLPERVPRRRVDATRGCAPAPSSGHTPASPRCSR